MISDQLQEAVLKPGSHPDWDARNHKVMAIRGSVFHGTTVPVAKLLKSRQGPRHPDARVKVRQWIGPIGFYVTKVLERARSFANHHAKAKGSIPSVLSWDAKKLGLDRVLFSIRDPTAVDIQMAKELGLSGVRGPGEWGILVFDPKPVPGKEVSL